MFLTRQAVKTGWWEIDIHGCYSLVMIAFAPFCACKNNRQIWRHNASASRSHDVTDQLRWRHNVDQEKTILSVNGEISDRWLFVEEWCVQDIKLRVRNKIIHSLQWITIFLVTSEVICQWFSNHLTRDQTIVIHGNSCIILDIFRKHAFSVLLRIPCIHFTLDK